MRPSETTVRTGDRAEVIETVIFVKSELSEACRQDRPYCVLSGWWGAQCRCSSCLQYINSSRRHSHAQSPLTGFLILRILFFVVVCALVADVSSNLQLRIPRDVQSAN
jgi:hypothetical protein